MPEQPRRPIKNCPVCGVAMLESKADDSLIDSDTFTCPNCRMVVSYERRRRDATGSQKSEIRSRKSEA